MAGIFGHRWTAAMGESPDEGNAGALWAAGLKGMSDQALRRGIDACVHGADDWPPSLPAFRRMCLDVPSLAQVQLAVRSNDPGAWPEGLRRFMVLVYRHLDSYRLRMTPADRADRMIADAYGLARDAVLRGDPLPDAPAGSLAAPTPAQRAPSNPDVAARALDAVQAVLRGQDAGA